MHLMSKQEKAEQAEKMALQWCDADDAGFEGWRKHYARLDYIAFDGGVIQVYRPRIDHDIYYDDETPDPLGDTLESKKAGFMAHNLRYNWRDFGISEWIEQTDMLDRIGCCAGWRINEPFIAMWPGGECNPHFTGHLSDIEFDEMRGMVRRPMTEEERGQLIEIMQGLREKYVKRLETYWKKYSDKIYSHGYWANR